MRKSRFSELLKNQPFKIIIEMKISVKSPIGKGLLGKKIGDIAEVTIPAGKITFEILHISLGI